MAVARRPRVCPSASMRYQSPRMAPALAKTVWGLRATRVWVDCWFIEIRPLKRGVEKRPRSLVEEVAQCKATTQTLCRLAYNDNNGVRTSFRSSHFGSRSGPAGDVRP